MSNGIKSSMAVELSENELDIVAGGCSCDTGYKQTKETEHTTYTKPEVVHYQKMSFFKHQQKTGFCVPKMTKVPQCH